MATTLQLLPTEIDIEVTQGTDNPIEFQLQRKRPTDGVIEDIDIANDTIKFTAKDSFGGSVKIATKTNGPAGHSSPASGKTIFTLTKTDTTTADPSGDVVWYYEIRRVDAANSDQEYVHIQGTLTLKAGVGVSA